MASLLVRINPRSPPLTLRFSSTTTTTTVILPPHHRFKNSPRQFSSSTPSTIPPQAHREPPQPYRPTKGVEPGDPHYRDRTRIDHFIVVAPSETMFTSDNYPLTASTADPPTSPQTLQERIACALKRLRPKLLQDDYIYDKTSRALLGEGRFGKIRAGIQRSTGASVAIKTVSRFHCKRDPESGVPFEVSALRSLNPANPLSVRYVAHYETALFVHIVTERLMGPSLFDFSNDVLKWEPVTNRRRERDVKDLVRRLAVSVLNCHRAGWAHLDVKFENFMWRKPGEETSGVAPVLIDYGFARPLPPGGTLGKLRGTHGSPSYAAPEMVFRNEYNELSDAWSLGVITFGLMQGYLPYCFDDVKCAKDYDSLYCGPLEWSKCSRESLDFVKRLLTVDVDKRMSVREALEHPWMAQPEMESSRDPAPPAQQQREASICS